METKKNPEKDIERKRFQLFETGMIITLIFVFLSFQYKTSDLDKNTLGDIQGVELPDEIIPITIAKQKPVPPKIKVKIITEIKQISNESEIPEEDDDNFWKFIDDDSSLDSLFDLSTDEDNVEDDIVYSTWMLNEQPKFNGSLNKYYQHNIHYPPLEKENNIEGTVWISFIIEKDGSVTDVSVYRPVSPGLDTEAVRVIRNMPKWIPGKQMQKPVRVKFVQPIKFAITE